MNKTDGKRIARAGEQECSAFGVMAIDLLVWYMADVVPRRIKQIDKEKKKQGCTYEREHELNAEWVYLTAIQDKFSQTVEMYVSNRDEIIADGQRAKKALKQSEKELKDYLERKDRWFRGLDG